MILFQRMGMALLIAALAGCASQVTRPTEPATTREPVRALTSFEIEVSPAAKAEMAEAEAQSAAAAQKAEAEAQQQAPVTGAPQGAPVSDPPPQAENNKE